jgi:hypothetical protein
MTFVEHRGGPNPHHDPDDPKPATVRVRYRNGLTSEPVYSTKRRWPWGGKFPRDGDWDIVASEVVSPAPAGAL